MHFWRDTKEVVRVIESSISNSGHWTLYRYVNENGTVKEPGQKLLDASQDGGVPAEALPALRRPHGGAA